MFFFFEKEWLFLHKIMEVNKILVNIDRISVLSQMTNGFEWSTSYLKKYIFITKSVRI